MRTSRRSPSRSTVSVTDLSDAHRFEAVQQLVAVGHRLPSTATTTSPTKIRSPAVDAHADQPGGVGRAAATRLRTPPRLSARTARRRCPAATPHRYPGSIGRPCSMSCGTSRRTVSTGMAKPIPADGAARAVDGAVDADQPAAELEQRTARITGVDRGVGLDHVVNRAGHAGELQLAPESADHADGQRVVEPEGVADRQHPLSDQQVARSRPAANGVSFSAGASMRSTARSLSGAAPDHVGLPRPTRRPASPGTRLPASITW